MEWEIADHQCPQGSIFAHLYGLPKTHEKNVEPILSTTNTYNYKLAKWLDEKLKPFVINEYFIDNIFDFAEDI